jgi:hypothetical protein
MSFTNDGLLRGRCQCFNECATIRDGFFATLFFANPLVPAIRPTTTCVVPGCPLGDDDDDDDEGFGKKSGKKGGDDDDDDDDGFGQQSGKKGGGDDDDDGFGTSSEPPNRLGATLHGGGAWNNEHVDTGYRK